MAFSNNHQKALKNITFYYLQDLEIIQHTQGHTGRSRLGRENARPWGSAFIGVEGEGLGFCGSLFVGEFKT